MNEKKWRRLTACLLVLSVLICLAGCKGKDKPASSLKRPDMDALKAATVGSSIFFGQYEQDNDTSTGKEAIEWLVLNKQEDKILVVSRFGLDSQKYHKERTVLTWQDASLREWLNDTFYQSAFIEDEKKLILDSEVPGDPNPRYGTTGGRDTTDRVFLLSFAEVNKYFVDEYALLCPGTPYCEAQGEHLEAGYCCWWLRTPGADNSYAMYVTEDGAISISGSQAHYNCAVRPAMWIELEPWITAQR